MVVGGAGGVGVLFVCFLIVKCVSVSIQIAMFVRVCVSVCVKMSSIVYINRTKTQVRLIIVIHYLLIHI